MRRWIALSVIALIIASAPDLLVAQPDTLWTRTYGGAEDDYGQSVVEIDDGGYMMVGSTTSYGAGQSDVYLLRIDPVGDILWAQTYGGGDNDYGYDIFLTPDGGSVLAGETSSFGAGKSDIYLIKTDVDGDTLWTRTYGGADWDKGYSVDGTMDGGFVVVGYTNSSGAGLSDIYLVRTDSIGDTLWTKTYGGENFDCGYSVVQASDSGYVLTGYTGSYGSGWSSVYIIKTDSKGDTLWTKVYGGTDEDLGHCITEGSGGTYIMAGTSWSYGPGGADVWVITLDSTGQFRWARTYGGVDLEYGLSVDKTFDGGFLIVGRTSSFGAGDDDIYMIRTRTGSSGDTLWSRTYGGAEMDQGNSVVRTSEGGYIIAGNTYSFGAGGSDVYLLRFQSEVGVDEESESRPTQSLMNLWPNPSPGICQVSFEMTKPGRVCVVLYDLAGRMVKRVYDGHRERGEQRFMVDTRSLPSGIYFLHMKAPDRSSSLRLAVVSQCELTD
jgi:hypothetical protein